MEMMQLLPAIKKYPYYIITEKNAMSYDIVRRHNHHFLLQQERKSATFAFRFLYNILASLYYFILEHPKVIISTGAGAAYPTCRIGKWLGAKIIYIESFAKHDSQSLTGKMVYPFADFFFVQWPEMKSVYKKSQYHGTVY